MSGVHSCVVSQTNKCNNPITDISVAKFQFLASYLHVWRVCNVKRPKFKSTFQNQRKYSLPISRGRVSHKECFVFDGDNIEELGTPAN